MKLKYNNDFICRRCPLNDGCFTTQQIKVHNGWVETEKMTPAKLRCHGMRGVTMAMGIVLKKTVNTSTSQPKEIEGSDVAGLKKLLWLSEKKTIVLPFEGLFKKFQIFTKSIQRRRQALGEY